MDTEDIERFGLLRYVVPEKIDIGEYETPKFGVICPDGLILINKSDSLEEQVKSILHEVIHMHPKFISYTGGLWENTISRNDEYEKRIEQFVQQVYSQREDIVNFIIARLNEARVHSSNPPF